MLSSLLAYLDSSLSYQNLKEFFPHVLVKVENQEITVLRIELYERSSKSKSYQEKSQVVVMYQLLRMHHSIAHIPHQSNLATIEHSCICSINKVSLAAACGSYICKLWK